MELYDLIEIDKLIFRDAKSMYNLSRSDVKILISIRRYMEITKYTIAEIGEIDRGLVFRRVLKLLSEKYITERIFEGKKMYALTKKGCEIIDYYEGSLSKYTVIRHRNTMDVSRFIKKL